MKSLILAAALGFSSLGLVGLTPSQADASWLSEMLNARYAPYYYDGYYNNYYDGYYPPAYVYPNYGYYNYGYYARPYYGPGGSYYRGFGPRHYGHWHDYGNWHVNHGGWHGHSHYHHR